MEDISHGGKPARISEPELLRSIPALFCSVVQSPTSPLTLTMATPVLAGAAAIYSFNEPDLLHCGIRYIDRELKSFDG